MRNELTGIRGCNGAMQDNCSFGLLLQHLQKEKEELVNNYNELYESNKDLTLNNQNLQNEKRLLEAENQHLKEKLKLANERKYGAKSEKAQEGAEENELCSIELIAVQPHTRKVKKKGRLVDMSFLPEHIIEHDLSEEEKACQVCQKPLELIGEERSEGQLEIMPFKYYKAVHVRKKYCCRECEKIKVAKKPISPIPKAIAGSGLLTEVLVGKYQCHLPLYRQAQMMLSVGINIPDNTLGNWVMTLGKGLMYLYEAFLEEIVKVSYLQVDETPVKILSSNKKGYVWTYVAPINKIVLFEFASSRSKAVVESTLTGFKGLLQTDGYGGYENLKKQEGIYGLGCLTHSRRKFAEVYKLTKDKMGIAAQVIEMLKPVYALESRMKDAGIEDHRVRKRLRQKHALPLLKRVRLFLKVNQAEVMPNSPLGGAINYFLKHWHYLIGYTRHGKAEIDTNMVENKIRPIALGRKNWLFIGNQNSGRVHALFYSLVLSAILNRLNPTVYLHYVLTQIHKLRKKEVKPLDLLPHRIDKTILETFAEQLLAQAKAVLDTS